jgi:predicted nuclease of predicted toxin-antitoxin system
VIKFYIDVHVPRAITEGLRRRGVEVITAQEDGSRRLSDETLLERATHLEHVLVSADEDFTIIAADWQGRGIYFSGVVRLTRDLTNVGLYVRELELLAKAAKAHELANVVTHLPL